MKANELKIGNLIQYNEGEECKVIGIHEFGIDVEFPEETTYIEYDQFSPIPLTKECLVKFGFKIEDDIATYSGRQHEFDIYTENGKTWKPLDYKGGFRHIYYVHQLQNLYFALTGEEL